MWTNPSINSDDFQRLNNECMKRRLRLWLARDLKAYYKMNANYAVYCKFTNMEICTGETLQEIANFLKIGGVYD